jgi:hypothetical protein
VSRPKRRSSGVSKLDVYLRAQEAIDYLMECDGITDLPKKDFAVVMGARHPNKGWLLGDGTGNAALVAEICTLSREQPSDGYAASTFAGYVIDYAPSIGGMHLVDPAGKPSLEGLVHMLMGDMQRQQTAKTVNRRRIEVWNAVGHQAFDAGNADLGRVAFQIEREINATGFAADSLVMEFASLIEAMGRGDAA